MRDKDYTRCLLWHIRRCTGNSWWSCDLLVNMAVDLHGSSEDCKHLYYLLTRFARLDDAGGYNINELYDYLMNLTGGMDEAKAFYLLSHCIKEGSYYDTVFQINRIDELVCNEPKALVGFAEGRI